MAPRSRFVLAASAGLAIAGLFAACTLPKKAPDEGENIAPQNVSDEAGFQSPSVTPDATPTEDPRNDLCGKGADHADPTASGCNPDQATAIDPSDCPQGSGGAGGGGGVLSCQVRDAPSGHVAQCAPAGTGDVNEGCSSASDCAPGLACVVSATPGNVAGQCRPYCCYGTCDIAGTYCADVARVGVPAGVTGAAALVPACLVSSSCRLLDPSSCDPGQACAAVGKETTCLPTGTAVAGQFCNGVALQCAADYVCLRSTQTCRHICHLGDDSLCPDGSVCVSGGEDFPRGFGVCSE